MHTTELSLRERQRLETFERLHLAAASLAETEGIAAATVDAIAERAGVSRRTFFNYFPGKEDAILGLTRPQIPAEVLEGARSIDLDAPADDRFRRAVHLLVATTRASRRTVGGFARRRELIERMPELGGRLKRQSQEIQDLVLEQLAGPDTPLGERVAPDLDLDRARALVLLAAAVIRYAFEQDPQVFEGDDPSAFDPTIALFRSILKEA
ncbi:TetR/AcrR family transcriptional regulator [Brachybacterium sp. DNPG3]